MTKPNFIQLLTTLSKEDIDRLIKEKGKPRKPIKAFIHLEDLEDPEEKKTSCSTK